MIKITLPFRTPTINHLFWHRGNIKILKNEARELRERIKKLCRAQLKKQKFDLAGKKLKLIVNIYEDWNTKKGEVKRKDISNREKFLTDSVFSAIEMDDKFIFEHTMKKIQSDKEKIVITIEALKE